MAPLRSPVQGHPLSPPPGDVRGLYVHIPFCRVRCPYCDFATAPYTERGAERMVSAVLAEAGARAAGAGGAPPVSVFVGGGTPSRLEAGEFLRLAGGLRERFGFVGGVEFTVEANPEDVDVGRLAGWRQAGVSRVSLGVQSLAEGARALRGRRHGAPTARGAAGAVGEAFSDWSLDLIYGFPGHERASWLRTLAGALALSPPHVSAYHFTAEPRTPLGDAVLAGRVRVPDGDAAAELFEAAVATLAGAGYRQYEVSNFALAGHESRHNRLYWRRRPYLGLGPAAVSFVDERRRRNVADVEEYVARALAGRDPVEEEEDVRAQAGLETFLLGLRLADGVPWSAVAALGAAGEPWRDAALGLAERGHLEVDGAGIRISAEQRRVTDEIVLMLWREAEARGARVDSRGKRRVQ